MKRTFLIAAAALPFAVCADTPDEDLTGPAWNPETQRRIVWHCGEKAFDDFAAMGFNATMGLVTGYGFGKEIDRETAVSRRRKILEAHRRAGLEFMESYTYSSFSKVFGTGYPRVRLDGTKKNVIDMSNGECFARATHLVDGLARSIESEDLPTVLGVMTSSEVRDNSFPSITDWTKAAWAKHSGGRPMPPNADRKRADHYSTIPGFPVSRVVETDDPTLAYFRWFWKEGDGWNDFQSAASDSYVRRFAALGARAMTMYDPAVRVPPIWGSGGRVTHLNQWTYVYPEPFNISYVTSELQEMARGVPGQRVNSMIQGISYRSSLAPRAEKPTGPAPQWYLDKPDVKYMSTPGDMAREALWTLFSHKLDSILFHGYQSIVDITAYGLKESNGGYQFTDPTLRKTIAELFNGVAEPLGPLFKALPETGDEVAMVESYSASIFAARGGMGTGSNGLCDFGALATLASLQPRVLYEEDIAANGIPSATKVLLMPHCDVLTRPVFEAVRAFQAAGGHVVGDKFLVPGILPDALFPVYLKTFVAAHDTPVFRKAAQELKASVAAFLPPVADTDRDDVFVRRRVLPGADYVFAINDRRGPGDYVGAWGHVWEKGLPNRATVRVRRPATGAVYDLVRHARVPFELKDGRVEIPVSYETNDGRLLMLVDRPLAPLAVSWSAAGLEVVAQEKDAMIPISVSFDGAKPLYGCIRGGRWRPAFAVPAGAKVAKVTSLVTGETFTATRK